jgi:LPPG:FO 2-phospho-L-lactate transferase
VRYEGLKDARPASGVVEAINGADLILIAESSPVASILPILEMPGLRQALRSAGGLRVAISPIILAVPPRRPLDVLHWRARAAPMRAAGLEHHPSEVARLYSGLIDAFVLDRRDIASRPAGVEIIEVDLLDRSDEARRRLVELLVGLRNPGQFAGSPAR